MTASAASRSGRYGAGRPGRPARPWHAWRTGTPARRAAARMQATAANKAHCHKSSACRQATSSSRSGSVPPRKAAATSTAHWTLVFPGRRRRPRAGTARVVPPGAAGRPGWPAPIQRAGGEVEEHLAGEGIVAGARPQARSPARRRQRHGRARRAGPGGRSRHPRGIGRFLAGISPRQGRSTDRRAALPEAARHFGRPVPGSGSPLGAASRHSGRATRATRGRGRRRSRPPSRPRPASRVA